MTTSTPVDTVPLTVLQRGRLLVDCLPVVFMVAAFAFCITLLDNLTGQPAPPALLLLLGLVILVTGWTAFQRLRDIVAGVALVREDTLERSYRSRGGQGTSRCFGHFTQLGRLQLSSRAFVHSHPGQRYRVVYSPASRLAWALDPSP